MSPTWLIVLTMTYVVTLYSLFFLPLLLPKINKAVNAFKRKRLIENEIKKSKIQAKINEEIDLYFGDR